MIVQSSKKKKVALNVGQRNAVAILNELRTGLKYTTLAQTGPCHNPQFQISVVVDGQEYIGVGSSKKAAKHHAAEQALKSFIQFPNNNKVISPNSSVDSSLDFTSDLFEAGQTQKQKTNGILDQTKALTKGPVMLLNELYSNAIYECTSNEGDIYSRFKVTVKIDGETFIGTGSSKKLAKNAAASSALCKLLSLKTGTVNPNVSSKEQETADFIGRYCDIY